MGRKTADKRNRTRRGHRKTGILGLIILFSLSSLTIVMVIADDTVGRVIISDFNDPELYRDLDVNSPDHIYESNKYPIFNDLVNFQVQIIYVDNVPEEITCKFYHDDATNKESFVYQIMMYDAVNDKFVTNLPGYPVGTKIYYYTVCNDGANDIRTPVTSYSHITWYKNSRAASLTGNFIVEGEDDRVYYPGTILKIRLTNLSVNSYYRVLLGANQREQDWQWYNFTATKVNQEIEIKHFVEQTEDDLNNERVLFLKANLYGSVTSDLILLDTYDYEVIWYDPLPGLWSLPNLILMVLGLAVLTLVGAKMAKHFK
jgi:hypothetical protein